MSFDRETIEQRLADDGLAALSDPAVKRAVAADPELRELVLALQELDAQLAALPPIDPPDGLIASTLAGLPLEAAASKTEAEAVSVAPPAPSVATPPSAQSATPGTVWRAPAPERRSLFAMIGKLLEGLGRHPIALASVAIALLAVLALNKVFLQYGNDDAAVQSAEMATGGDDGWGDDELASGFAGPSAPPQSAPRPSPTGTSSTTERGEEMAAREMLEEEPEEPNRYRRRRNDDSRRQDRQRDRDRDEEDRMNWEQSGELGRLAAVDQPQAPRDMDGALSDDFNDRRQIERDFAAPVQAREGRLIEQGQGAAGSPVRSGLREGEELSVRLRAQGRPDANANRLPLEETEEEMRFDYGVEGQLAELPAFGNIELRTSPDMSNVTIDGEPVGGSRGFAQSGQQGLYALDIGDSTTLHGGDITPNELNLAQSFLVERDQTAELTFREATGYWSNTYVPGDPLARQLRRRLEVRSGNNGLAMALDTRPVLQPFDRPESGALTLQLQSDRSGVEGETRVLLQVGLQATERSGGLRPAMNVAVVLDMRQALDEQASDSLRALLESLSEARQIGDRFGVYVAGRPGGELIAPGELRYGTVQLAVRYLLDGESLPEESASDELLDIEAAMERAIEATRAIDDPTAPLGTSLLMLVTPGSADGSFEPVVELAHLSAVGGVPVSVVALDTQNLSTLDRIALAGHGNRRLLLAAGEAADMVSRELNAASQVVARALRLNIRLAPGVQLIDVLGSEHLDERRAQQEREAERSIDVRVARSLGIQADRGDDDNGIQVIIPAFYSGDSHVVLLDVVVPGPGPVADVTVRYKDLVHLRNGEASNRLTLSRGDRARGQLELNVLRNLLAWRVSETLREAGGWLADGSVVEAQADLRAVTELLIGIGFEVPGLGGDPGVAADLRLLSGYLGQLESYAYGDLDELAESMIYASYLKRLRPLDEREGAR